MGKGIHRLVASPFESFHPDPPVSAVTLHSTSSLGYETLSIFFGGESAASSAKTTSGLTFMSTPKLIDILNGVAASELARILRLKLLNILVEGIRCYSI